jgi:hypothetical protein
MNNALRSFRLPDRGRTIHTPQRCCLIGCEQQSTAEVMVRRAMSGGSALVVNFPVPVSHPSGASYSSRSELSPTYRFTPDARRDSPGFLRFPVCFQGFALSDRRWQLINRATRSRLDACAALCPGIFASPDVRRCHDISFASASPCKRFGLAKTPDFSGFRAWRTWERSGRFELPP